MELPLRNVILIPRLRNPRFHINVEEIQMMQNSLGYLLAFRREEISCLITAFAKPSCGSVQTFADRELLSVEWRGWCKATCSLRKRRRRGTSGWSPGSQISRWTPEWRRTTRDRATISAAWSLRPFTETVTWASWQAATEARKSESFTLRRTASRMFYMFSYKPCGKNRCSL